MIAPRTQSAATATHPHWTIPYTVVIDSREQHPYSFQGIKADANRSHLPLIVPVQVAGLRTGDYSILGLEDQICVERKSLADLYSTISRRRKQFESEHERMAEFRCACVVIEASLVDVVSSPPEHAKISPKIVYRTFISWCHRYGIPWHFCETRSLAERTTFRVLNWFWEEQKTKKKELT